MTSAHSATQWEALVKSGREDAAAEPVAAGIYVVRGLGSAYLLTTSDGDVLVNAGMLEDAQRGRPMFARVSSAPLRYAILTQSHVNQFGGLGIYMTAETKLITHRRSADIRAYWRRLRPYYSRRTGKLVASVVGSQASSFDQPDTFTADILVDDRFDFALGERRFEVISTPGGETHDSMVVWLPDEKIAVIGNLFGPIFGNQPNLNTIRGDKIRSALEFIESAKRLRALGADLLLSGRERISGAEAIRTTITRMIDAVQWLHDQTIDGMNAGKGLYQLMREIQLPDSLKLGEAHGKAAWNVRAIWTEYSGWFDYNEGTTGLYDAPRSSINAELAALAGGVAPLVDAAQAHVTAGRSLEALYLLDIALAADAKSDAARAVKRAALVALSERAARTANLSETMWLRAELADLDDR